MKRDIELSYTDEGEGAPPLVLVHGITSARDDWRLQADWFSARHRVVRPDLRGHGATPRGTEPLTIATLGADVAALLEALNLTGAVLAGGGMSCRVVLEARRLAPERVAALVWVDFSNLGLDGKEPAQRAMDEFIAAKGYEAAVRERYQGLFLAGHDPALSGPIIERALALPEEVSRSLFHDTVAYDAEQALKAMRGVHIPVLVLQSTTMGADRVRRALEPGEVSPSMELARTNFPQATVEAIPGTGHFAQLQAPEAVNAALAALLQKLSG